jgi:fucose 4-O-acetylase-like acetyltransferase
MFPFFPWGAFVAFGLSFGSILRLAQEQDYMKVIQWAALFGFVTVFSAQYVSNLPYSLYTSVDFWLNSPALIFIKTGVILVLVAFAFLWTRYMNPSGWSFVRQLGTTSLLVYWVHTEIVYGSLLWKWKENLAVPQVVAAAILVISSMVALSVARTGWKGSPGVHTLLRQRWAAWRTDLANQPAGD